MSNEIDVERRRFLEVVATTVAATQFGVSALARSTLKKTNPRRSIHELRNKQAVRVIETDRCGERDVAEALAPAAHQSCPYSKATRGNIDVTIIVA